MSGPLVDVIACPPALSVEALALVLADLTPEQRREYAPVTPGEAVEGLVVALEGQQLRGAAWGQRQPGSTAILWPPRLTLGTDREIAVRLARAAATALDAAGVRMTQVLLHDQSEPVLPPLQAAGFEFLASLLYLEWECRTGAASPAASELEFETYRGSQQDRLLALVEATYEATRDCVALGGARPMHEVLDGYRATGTFSPENWLFVRAAGKDVGVLLLAEHLAARYLELMYMGLVPGARGRKWGCDVVRHAQRLADRGGAARIVLAVDAENTPAIKMYNETGFRAWDRRSVFVRFAPADARSAKSP
jgi:mycothiol synthase